MLELLNLFGIGQCGCRVGKEFAKVGFNCNFINSDVVDMRGFDVTPDRILMLADTGSGRSPQKGRTILENNFEKFTKFMDKNLDPKSINTLIVGLGGGTGGGMALPALQYIKQKGFKAGLIATLPPKMCGMLDMDNAMRGLRELKDVDVDLYLLIDNDYLMTRVGLSTDWWQKINYYILTKIISIFDITRSDKLSQVGIGSIDKGEISRILQYGKGLLDIREAYFNLPEDVNLSDDELKLRLFEPDFIAGYNYRDTLFYLTNVDVPRKGGYTEFASRIFNISKATYGSALARIGMFNDPLLEKVARVTMISTGLKLPKVLRSKIRNLQRDADRHDAKKGKKDITDFSSMRKIRIDDDFAL